MSKRCCSKNPRKFEHKKHTSMKGAKIMNEEYLNLLEKIRATLEDIKSLQEDLGDLLDNPVDALEHLEKLRDTLEDIRGLQEEV